MQEDIYQKAVRDTKLKQRLIETWSGIYHSIIDPATYQSVKPEENTLSIGRDVVLHTQRFMTML